MTDIIGNRYLMPPEIVAKLRRRGDFRDPETMIDVSCIKRRYRQPGRHVTSRNYRFIESGPIKTRKHVSDITRKESRRLIIEFADTTRRTDPSSGYCFFNNHLNCAIRGSDRTVLDNLLVKP